MRCGQEARHCGGQHHEGQVDLGVAEMIGASVSRFRQRERASRATAIGIPGCSLNRRLTGLARPRHGHLIRHDRRQPPFRSRQSRGTPRRDPGDHHHRQPRSSTCGHHSRLQSPRSPELPVTRVPRPGPEGTDDVDKQPARARGPAALARRLQNFRQRAATVPFGIALRRRGARCGHVYRCRSDPVALRRGGSYVGHPDSSGGGPLGQRQEQRDHAATLRQASCPG